MYKKKWSKSSENKNENRILALLLSQTDKSKKCTSFLASQMSWNLIGESDI